MAIRYLRVLWKNGKLFKNPQFYRRDLHQTTNNYLQASQTAKTTSARLQKTSTILANEVKAELRNNRFSQFSRRLFVDNVLGRVTSPVSSALRAEATRKFAFGDSLPFFSLVGVSLASGSGVLTKDDELEGICWEIREAVSHYQSKLEDKVINRSIGDDLKLENLDIGPPIAKGCNAVVYAAAFKNQSCVAPTADTTVSEPIDIDSLIDRNLLSPVCHVSRLTQSFGDSADRLHQISNPLLTSTNFRNCLNESSDNFDVPTISNVRRVKFNEDVETRNRSNESVASSTFEDTTMMQTQLLSEQNNIFNYPWALKMMFNYDIQSNAMAILRAMHKETVPARRQQMNVENWERQLMEQTNRLPAHPNIVMMPGYFCDQIPNLLHAKRLYPNALPMRLHSEGYGRNMSLFMLMKRYDHNLCDFLTLNDVPMRTRVVMFAQLLEANAHLNRFGVAHRDLKSDNILIDASSDSLPILVLSDFGCCIADKKFGLRMPYPTDEICKGGNQALMAPEIINKQPGTFSVLNYTKSDLWACGTIAYEIFGYRNPFYSSTGRFGASVLRNVDYDDSMLPQMADDVPFIARKLVENMVQRNPSNRLSSDVAANVMQLYLWAPSAWVKFGRNPTNNEILQWLLSLTTKVLCEGSLVAQNLEYNSKSRRTYTEYILIATFLARAKLRTIRQALNWIHQL